MTDWAWKMVTKSKVKVPNLLLKFNINGLGLADKTGNIMYIPTYMYIYDNKEKESHEIYRRLFYSTFIKKVSNKYYFKPYVRYNEEVLDVAKMRLGKRFRDVYLKWEINEDFSVVDEYLDLCDGNGWQHTVKFEKIK